MGTSNSVFMKARCLNTRQIFYYRYDYNACNRWVLSETVDEAVYAKEAGKQGGAVAEVDIRKAKDGPQYKGCKYCRNGSFVSCSCGEMHCFEGRGANEFFCPNDNTVHRLSGKYITTLKGSRAGQ